MNPLTTFAPGLVLGILANTSFAQIEEVSLTLGVDRVGGVLVPNPYDLRISVEGTGILAAEVEVPSGLSYPMFQTDEDWSVGLGGYASLADLESALGFGDFIVEVTTISGSETATVSFHTGPADPHTGYGEMITPLHGSVGAPILLDMEWQCGNGPCGDHAWYMELYDPMGPGLSFEADLPPTTYTWSPGCLTGSTVYEFYLWSSTDLLSGTGTTSTGQIFEYGGNFETSNVIQFTTEPSLGTPFCTSSENSTGAPATICAHGSASVSANDLALAARPVPDQNGIFFYGPGTQQAPFGNGTLCVQGPFGRLAVSTATNHTLDHSLDNTQPPSALTQITSGSTWYFQAWFRDPAGGGASFDLSNGLELQFLP